MNFNSEKDDVGAPAAIYCRVSSKAQTKRGDGLGSQESRCREFASFRKYSVEKVFTDDVTGKLAERPGMQAMLAWLRQNRKHSPVVVIDDISRFARGVEAHIKLRVDSCSRQEARSKVRRLSLAKTAIQDLSNTCWPPWRSINAKRTGNRPSIACARDSKWLLGVSGTCGVTATSG